MFDARADSGNLIDAPVRSDVVSAPRGLEAVGGGWSLVTPKPAAGLIVVTVDTPGERIAPANADGAAHLPEAATWAMMLLGFSGMGYALRRRSPTKARVRFT